MRGTFFLEGTELILKTQEESWCQGDIVNTSLEIKGEVIKREDFFFGLYLCDLKKLKKKEEGFLKENIITHSLKELKANNEFSFPLSIKAPITDTSLTPCLFVGNPKKISEGGLLQLQVKPWKPIQELLALIENFERFKIKTIKNKKDQISIALIPPASKEYGHIQSLTIVLNRTEEDLKFQFEFKIKKLGYEAGQVQSMIEKKVIKKSFPEKDLFFFGDSLNQDKILAFFKETLQETKRPVP